MAPKKSVEELIGRTIRDSEFRARLLANPEQTLKDEGFDADPDVVQAIKDTQANQIDQAAGHFAQIAGLDPPTAG